MQQVFWEFCEQVNTHNSCHDIINYYDGYDVDSCSWLTNRMFSFVSMYFFQGVGNLRIKSMTGYSSITPAYRPYYTIYYELTCEGLTLGIIFLSSI